jgi:alanyl-tRNA synthetase
MNSKQIRQKFIDFFVSRGHTHVPSSSLIPAQDPTILFTNAGMNQFKDVFLGKETRPYKRAVTVQKCARAGGKHNDLENVGFTKRHLVFFEMLGNFSFGDYFKREAIAFAWEFITKEMGLPKDKLYVSIYKDDDESFEIWNKEQGIPASRIYRLGEKENFWSMGDMGPCGPCTEIHIDRGPEWGCKDIEKCGPACDCDRFLEIWNNVFMQFDRQKDGSLKPLEKTGVDTGMGLERLCCIMQNKDSVFDTDLFTPIREKAEEISGKKYADQPDEIKAAFNVVAEHARSSSMLIADGCIPSNEGRGYVLRKIIRRAALFSQKLTSKSLLPELSQVVVKEFGAVYPELIQHKSTIEQTLHHEVEKFSENLVRGQALLDKHFQTYRHTKIIPGGELFKLYDTFGFPVELITVLAKERNFTLDMLSFEQEMVKQKERSGKQALEELDYVRLPEHINCDFTGYDELTTTSKIIAIIDENVQQVESLQAGSSGWIITEQSPLFAMGGGQAPDRGTMTIGNNTVDIQDVRLISGLVAAHITAPQTIKLNEIVTIRIDPQYRKAIMRNHTATHLLQAALMELVDKNVKQAGSFVSSDYLRFDFTTNQSLSHELLNNVELLVNTKIQDNKPVTIEYLPFELAKKKGALAFFEEKYTPERVRVVSIPDVSSELCCGTHVHATGDIGVFKITEIKAISASTRRIVAYTGQGAVKLFQTMADTLKDLGTECKVGQADLVKTIVEYKREIKEQAIAIKNLKKELRKVHIPQWLSQTEMINNIPFVYINLDGYTHEELKEISSDVSNKQPGLYVLKSLLAGRSIFIVHVSPSLAGNINLKKLSQWLKERHGISSGGSQTVLQGGSEQFDGNLKDSIKEWVKSI